MSEERWTRQGVSWTHYWRTKYAGFAEKANKCANLSRRPGAPTLRDDSERQTLIAWLVWCDPNGCWTDEDCDYEDFDRLTSSGAWKAIGAMLEEE